MANAVVMNGTIVAGPTGADSCAFPTGIHNIAFSTHPLQKVAAVSVKNFKNVNSPSSYVEMEGVGTGQSVTQGTFLFVQCTAPMKIRITTQPDSGGDVVSEIPVQGALVIEFAAANYLKLLESKGVGGVEYFVSGSV